MKRAVASIVIGERRREDLGDLDGLAESIAAHGLLHPIVVDDAGTLVAGQRRLEACKRLGWPDVDVRMLGALSTAERRLIELEENTRRKDLTPYEQSRSLVELVETARVVASEELVPNSGTNSKRGRPNNPASTKRAAERAGVARATLQHAEQHVAAVERYPELPKDAPQDAAIKAARALDAVPDPIRAPVLAAVESGTVAARDIPRELARHVAERERETGDSHLGAALARVPGAEQRVSDQKLREVFARGQKQARDTLLPLHPEAVARVLRPDDCAHARRFIADVRAWLAGLEREMDRPLRAVN